MDDLNLLLNSVQRAMDSLVIAFTWENSKEGQRYWSDVYDKLEYYRDLAKDESND